MTRKWLAVLPLSLCCWSISSISIGVKAQIIPDNTLGNESSVVTPLDSLTERIDGGASRGSNLFHSFREFNIKEGNTANFANPIGIQTIFSRVTGNNPSRLFGTLGVLGNAHLFFINPNGIIFGPNAKLNISGSFVGSTANSIVFPDGSRFSATNPGAAPLLTIDVPIPLGLEFEGGEPGSIINSGNLETGQNLALVGGTIDSTGELSTLNGQLTLLTNSSVTPIVQFDTTGILLGVDSAASASNEIGDISLEGASLQGQTINVLANNNLILLGSQVDSTGDLNLVANDTMTIQDSEINPLEVIAGGNLLIQGDQQIDIAALNHPSSELVSGGDSVLKSGSEVIGDARFWSGGSFRIEDLEGNVGQQLVSLDNPVVRSSGDVYIQAFRGASLHIIAGGKVEIPDGITIARTNETNGLVETVTLSNGEQVAINGKQRPTVDIRAGVKPEFIGSPTFLTNIENFSSPVSFTDTPTSAEILIGDIIITGANGHVFLTNQYQANPALTEASITVSAIGISGSFRVESAIIDSRGDVNIGGDINATSQGMGGNLLINAFGDVNISDSIVSVQGSDGGSININANNLMIDGEETLIRAGIDDGLGIPTSQAGDININVTDTIFVSGSVIANVVSNNGQGNAGDINIHSSSVILTDGAEISASTFGKGNAGAIEITASDSISLVGEDSRGRSGGVFSTIVSTGEGNSGGIVINTRSLSLADGAVINASTSSKGNAGAIQITASDDISLVGESSQGFVTRVVSAVGVTGEGNSGGIVIDTSSLSLIDGGGISASTFGKGNAGAVQVTASDSISLVGENSQGFASGVFSTVGPIAKGNSGGIVINTSSLSLIDARINANTSGEGNAGAIEITASDGISLAGGNSLEFGSGVFSTVRAGAEGNSGGIVIDTTSLSLTDGALINASTLSKGNAGAIQIRASNGISLAGENSQGRVSAIASQVTPTAEGNSGGIVIDTGSLSLTNGALINASTLGKGNAGAIKIKASDNISLAGENSQGRGSVIGSQVTPTAEGNSGGIIIDTSSLFLNDGAAITASTFGKGNAGTIEIKASDGISLVGKDSQGSVSSVLSQVASTAEGNAGSIILNAPQLTLFEGTIITASTSGEGDGGDIIINSPNSILLSKDSTLSVGTAGEGNAGNLTLETGQLLVQDRARISSGASGTGIGGDIFIMADNLTLNRGTISAQTASNTGGDITLDLQNLLTLRNGGQISTTAGTAQAGGDGGNIDINSPFIITSPFANSDITANAFTGRGGNIDITTQGIFGLEVRDTLTPFSDITASSAFGINGDINIDNLGIDPTRGIETLPQEVVNPQVFQGCQARDGQAISEFYRLGRGGIPSSPDDWLNEEPFGHEGLIPLETPLNTTPLQINWKVIPADGVFLSCQPSVSHK